MGGQRGDAMVVRRQCRGRSKEGGSTATGTGLSTQLQVGQPASMDQEAGRRTTGATTSRKGSIVLAGALQVGSLRWSKYTAAAAHGILVEQYAGRCKKVASELKLCALVPAKALQAETELQSLPIRELGHRWSLDLLG